MPDTALAAVQVAAETTELREFPLPDVPPDGALLKVEAAGSGLIDRARAVLLEIRAQG